MADVTTLGAGDVRVRVTGLRDTLRAMERAGTDAQDLRTVMRTLGDIVVTAARPRTRTKSGRMAASIRTGAGKTKAVVRMGRKSVPYAGVQHYGWPAHNISPDQSLVEAVQATRGRVLAELDKSLGDLLARHDLT